MLSASNSAISLPIAASQQIHAALLSTATAVRQYFQNDERGEGVISTAIAVLIMAFIGAAAFGLFRAIMTKAADTTTKCLDAFNSGGDNVTCGG